eukprot:GEMP01062254.1.p1 GENE.GEMP01062254.1~~GEMP01062254.1.p1  ORF type:complete len:227 (+),score=45.72 GEMP01062254.1:36-716(+)
MESLTYEDDSGSFTFEAAAPFDDTRKAIMVTAFPEVQHKQCFLVSTKENQDFIVTQDGSEYEVLVSSCSITYEDMSAASFVEYKFAEESIFRMAKVSVAALESYRLVKFKQWLDMLHNPTCEAQLRRMLQIGVVTRLFDKQLFPTPEEFVNQYRIRDEHTGKMIDVPHMVEQMRVWNSEKQQYEQLECHLDGAPPDSEREKWWSEKIAELKKMKGADYIESMHKDK